MRVPQPKGGKGSLKWIQMLLAEPGGALETRIREELSIPAHVEIDWRSPRGDDAYSEYRDASFLRELGLEHLEAELHRFWPARGPQWDALARIPDGRVVLIEAKAHAGELASSCTAGPASRELIDSSLEAAKNRYGAATTADWTRGYYQYANRLAHLVFLHDRKVSAELVFVYFVNDKDVRGPSSKAEWVPVLDECHQTLGLPKEWRVPGIHDIFVDVGDHRVAR